MESRGLGVAKRGATNLVKMVPGQLATAVILTLSGFLIARVLGVEGYGRYAAIMAVLAILQTASAGGLPMVETRYLAPLWSAADDKSAVALGSSIWTAHCILAAGAGVVAVLWFSVSSALQLDLWACLLLGVLCVMRCSFEATRNFFLAVGHAGTLVRFELVRAALSVLLVIGAFVLCGLNGVFVALLVLYLALFGASRSVLLRLIPLQFGHLDWRLLRPYLAYSGATFLSQLATMIQAQLVVYLVAMWLARQDAGFVAVMVQLFGVARGLFVSGRSSLMPLLAELAEQGHIDRLRYWGGLMMRYGAAAACLLAVTWSLIGEYVIRWSLTDAFAPVYPGVTLIFVSVIFFCCAGSCVGLLNTHGLAGVAALNTVVYAIATLAGLLFVLRENSPGAAYRIAWVYVIASAIFWAGAYLSLGLRGGIWLPVRRTVLLILPVVSVWPATVWNAPFLSRLAALGVFVAMYSGLVVWFKLLPADEIRQIVCTLRKEDRRPDTRRGAVTAISQKTSKDI